MILPGDVEAMRKRLEKVGRENDGWVIAWVHYLMKGLGTPQEVTAKDREAMENQLKKDRRKKRRVEYCGHALLP